MSNEQDRELLELAAKAAGMEGWRYVGPGPSLGMAKMIDPSRPGNTGYVGRYWNPLADDGDALRLANKLQLEVRHVHGKAHAGVPDKFWSTEPWFPDGNQDAATRRAITRAAAEIGRAMP